MSDRWSKPLVARIAAAGFLFQRLSSLPAFVRGLVLIATTLVAIQGVSTTPAAASMTCFCKVSVANLSGVCHPANSDILVDLTGDVNTSYSWPRTTSKWQSCQSKCSAALNAGKDKVCAAAAAASIAPGTVLTAFGALGNCGSKGEYDTAATITCPAPPTPHASCCPPFGGIDMYTVFKQVQTSNVSDPFALIYSPSLNPNYDFVLQQYINYVGAVQPNIIKMVVRYDLVDVTPPPPDVWASTFSVTYTKQGSGGVTGGGFVTGSPLLVNHTYNVTRVITFLNAAGQKVSYYDPNCKDRWFNFSINVVAGLAKPGAAVLGATATIHIEGQPDRVVPFVLEKGSPTQKR